MCRLTDIEIDILVRKNEALKDEVCELQHKNSELEIELKVMRGVANSYKAEIEMLRPFGCQVEVSKKIEQEIKAEAVKEFAERLKKEFKPEINYGVVANCAIKLFRNTIDYLVKEMTEKE